MQEFQQRVIDEQLELNTRVEALYMFIGGPIFATLDSAEQERLRSQFEHMSAYNRVLIRRVEAFNVKSRTKK